MDDQRRRVLELLKGLSFAEFWFTDAAGKPWRMDVAASHIKPETFDEGITLDGPSTGRPWKGLINMRPDARSCFVDPVAAAPTLAMFCDVRDGETGLPGDDPRGTLRRARRALSSVPAGALMMGAECEFFLLERDGSAADEEHVWDFLRELAMTLERAGISVEGFRFGPNPGQGRAQMRAEDALKTADQVHFHRYIAATLARRSGRRAAFSPAGPAGGYCYMPLHLALWRDGRNLFHDPSGWAATSAACRSFAAGLMEHAPALLASCAPTAASYARLFDAEGPRELMLSRLSPRAACRIPARTAAPSGRRLKFRLCDGAADPYRAFAAILAAGLDGITRGLEAPIEAAAYGPALPRSPEEAARALELDRTLRKEIYDGAAIFSSPGAPL